VKLNKVLASDEKCWERGLGVFVFLELYTVECQLSGHYETRGCQDK